MSPRRVNTEILERRRESLIKAGYAEILEKGVCGTTLASVISRAGISKGGALHYFRSRDELLFAVFEWLLAQLERTLDEVATAQGSPRARLASELEVLFHSPEVNRKLYLVLLEFVAVSLHSDRFRAALAAFFERRRNQDMRIIEEGIERQEFRPVKPEDVARTLRALVDGFCLQWMIEDQTENLTAYQDRCRAVLGACLLRP
jgi:AcrR family transcriptional regulator